MNFNTLKTDIAPARCFDLPFVNGRPTRRMILPDGAARAQWPRVILVLFNITEVCTKNTQTWMPKTNIMRFSHTIYPHRSCLRSRSFREELRFLPRRRHKHSVFTLSYHLLLWMNILICTEMNWTFLFNTYPSSICWGCCCCCSCTCFFLEEWNTIKLRQLILMIVSQATFSGFLTLSHS